MILWSARSACLRSLLRPATATATPNATATSICRIRPPLSFSQTICHRFSKTLSSSSVFSAGDSRVPKPTDLERDNLVTVPNLLCVSRIVLAPYVAHLITIGEFEWALGCFVYAGTSDMLDGMIARNFKGQASMIGSFLDPLADKILVAALFLSLTHVNLIPAALTSLVVSRDVLLVYAGCYIRYMSVEPPFTIKKYFDISLPSAQINPTTISKVNTMVQLILVASAITAPMYDLQGHPAFYGLCGLTACTTFASAVSYAFMKDTYRFKHRAYDHQFGKKLTAFIVFILFNAGFLYYFPSQEYVPLKAEEKLKGKE